MKTTLKQLTKKLDQLADCILIGKNRTEVEALETAKSLLIKRVFGVGASGGGFSQDGSALGEYSDAYLQRRLRKGLTNLQKNLYFDGNLRNSIQVGINNSKKVLGFTDLDLAEIARFQEESPIQVGEKIFALNTEELDITIDVMNNGVKRALKECFNTA
ncbi:MAG: hypothetical protein IPI96_16125 [Saprospiraceae bacterium]|nr:hypothetical protein [Saprospiraceae bacterium]